MFASDPEKYDHLTLLTKELEKLTAITKNQLINEILETGSLEILIQLNKKYRDNAIETTVL